MINPDAPVKQYKGVWLPKEILDNPELTPTEKILLAIIESLDDEQAGGCYASNKYFSEKLDTAERSIIRCIADLKDKGYLTQTKFDGRIRFLRVTVPKLAGQTRQIVRSEPTFCQVSEQGSQQGSDIKEYNKEAIISADGDSETRMKPSVLFTRLRSIFPKSRNDNRKKQIEAVEKLQSQYDLSDETILDGARALAKKGSWNIDGSEIPITLSALLLADDLGKTAKKLMVFAESEEKKKTFGGPTNVD